MIKQMRAGRVCQIRVNPKDCMTIVDIVEDAHMLVQGMSFSRAVSIALSCALEVLRHNKLVPERDGFEYTKIMSPFPDDRKGNTAFNYALSKNVDIQSENWKPPVQQLQPHVEQEQDLTKHNNPEVRRLYREGMEMLAKREIDPENFNQAHYNEIEQQLGKLV